jgi:hypothetical protein
LDDFTDYTSFHLFEGFSVVKLNKYGDRLMIQVFGHFDGGGGLVVARFLEHWWAYLLGGMEEENSLSTSLLCRSYNRSQTTPLITFVTNWLLWFC